MPGKLLVFLPVLEPRHREIIQAAAEKNGFQALFFEQEEEALSACGDAEILFTQSALIPARAPVFRWMCTPSAGVNTFVHLDAFRSGRAVLSNSSGAYGVTISEHVVMTTLEMLRRQPEYDAIVSRREWVRSLPVRSILGSRVAVLGTGDLGREIARRFGAFAPASLTGVNRSGANPEGLFDRVVPIGDLDGLLPDTDILIMTLPETHDTLGLLDARRLSLLPDQALIVNVGRGSAIDQAALEAQLRSGRLRAALDVFETEPVPADAPLWTCPNLLLTPHIAGNMTLPYTRERIVSLFLEDFDNYCSRRPLLRRIDISREY